MMENMIESNPWIISDTHFGHNNIIKYCSRPQNHNEIMIRQWAGTVGDNEDILHLGDVWFAGRNDIAHWIRTISDLPGNKYLIKGNHDGSSYPFKSAGFTILQPFIWKDIAFTHRPISSISLGKNSLRFSLEEWKINIHGHTHDRNFDEASDRDGHPIAGKIYVNASVEKINYSPIRLSDLLVNKGNENAAI